MLISFCAEPPLTDSLGVQYLYTMLSKHGYDISLHLDFQPFDVREYSFKVPSFLKKFASCSAKQTAQKILEKNPDVVCFSVVTDWYRQALEIAVEIKAISPVTPIVFGGPHVTATVKDTILEDAVDYACAGEGEIALLKLVQSIEKGDKNPKIPGIYYKVNGVPQGHGVGEAIENLDDLPIVNKKPFQDQLLYGRHIYTIMTGRGCFYRCTFCNSPYARQIYKEDGQTDILRRRSVKNVIDELIYAKQNYPFIKYVFFADDSFIQSRGWAREFAIEYKKHIGLPFWCQTIPILKDEEMIQLLAEAGWINVELGVQSADERIRNNILLRPESNEQIKHSVQLLKKHGVYVNIDHIIGLPTDDVGILKNAIAYYSEARPDWLNVFSLKYYPGTALTLKAHKMGVLTDDDIKRINQGYPLDSSSGSYLRVGDSDSFRRFSGIMSVMTLLPFLSDSFLKKFSRSGKYDKLMSYVPGFIFLLSRTLRGIFEKRDFVARAHLKRVASLLYLSLLSKFSKSFSQKGYLPAHSDIKLSGTNPRKNARIVSEEMAAKRFQSNLIELQTVEKSSGRFMDQIEIDEKTAWKIK
jgi:pyruvate-formate lyase-activating enzyme